MEMDPKSQNFHLYEIKCVIFEHILTVMNIGIGIPSLFFDVLYLEGNDIHGRVRAS